MKDVALSQPEREFAEANIALLEQFMWVYHLDDELYGRMCVRYLKTAQRYLGDSGLREKYRFSTIVRFHLRSELSHVLRESLRADFAVPPERLDRLGQDDNLESVIALWDVLEQSLTKRQLEALRLRLSGLTCAEIARRCGITARAVEKRFERMKSKASKILNK